MRVSTTDAEVTVTSRDAWVRSGLTEGQAVSLTEALERIRAAEPAAAHERALRLLTYRERSRAELAKRLAEDGYPASVVDAELESLGALGLLDDRRFAESYARAKRLAGWGRPRIASGLASKGIADDLAEAVLEDACPWAQERYRATAVLRAAPCPASSLEHRRLARRLVSRGFTWQDALAAVRDATADDDAR